MDRTAWIVVTLCIALMGAYYFYWVPAHAPEPAPPRPAAPTETAGEPSTPELPEPPTEPAEVIDEETFTLENDLTRFVFTNRGGGIARAQLLDHTQTVQADELITLNRHRQTAVGALAPVVGEFENLKYEVESQSESEIVFKATNSDGLNIRKAYRLDSGSEDRPADPHLLHLELTVTNARDQGFPLTGYTLYTGSAAPLHPKEWAQQTAFLWSNGRKMKSKDPNFFREGGFLGFTYRQARDTWESNVEELAWAGVMNQFYASIVRQTEQRTVEIWSRPFPVTLKGAEEESQKSRLTGVELALGLPETRLEPGTSQTLNYDIFLGPKEYDRLADLPDQMKDVMGYNRMPVFGPIVKPVSQVLVRVLTWLQAMVHNYGLAIILMTALIRVVIWPLHSRANRTMKRMSQLTPKMTELREKYKDDPQKLNQEMMGLYRKYGVNPFGGCLPMFLQLPIFLGFYRMLMSAVELRHESFLWIGDLSMPDTIFEIGGFPINLMPIIMTITSVAQMAVTPKSGDKMQQRMFMFMPLIFLVICYNFASALALYWTCQNIFSAGQTWLFNKRQPPELQEVKGAKKGKSFLERLQEQAEAQQRARAGGGGGGGGAPKSSKPSFERGSRSTKSKRKKRK